MNSQNIFRILNPFYGDPYFFRDPFNQGMREGRGVFKIFLTSTKFRLNFLYEILAF